MEEFYVMANRKNYKTKTAASKEAGLIKSTVMFGRQLITVSKLADYVKAGKPMVMGNLIYDENDLIALKAEPTKRIAAKNRHWHDQRMFAVDVDNECGNTSIDYLDLTTAINHCLESGITPSLVTTTYSFSPVHHKFRMFFLMDKSINDIELHDRIVNALFNVISNGCLGVVDSRCKDLARLFYGSGKDDCVKYINEEAIVSIDSLLPLGCIEMIQPKKNNNRKNNENIFSGDVCKIDKIKKLIVFDTDLIRGSWQSSLAKAHFTVANDTCWITLNKFSIKNTQDLFSAFQLTEESPILPGQNDVLMQLLRFTPLNLLLGIDYGISFSCILPRHKDTNPSARLELRNDGSSSYHCYGCCGASRAYDPIDVIQKLSGCSFSAAKKYLCKLLGISPETEKLRQHKEALAKAQEYILLDLPTEYPKLHAFMRRRNLHILYHDLHTLARQYIYETDNPDEHLIIASSKLIQAKLSKFYGRSIRLMTLVKRLHLLAQLGLIRVLSDEECPPKLLKNLRKWQIRNDMRYRPTVYAFPLLDPVVLQNATVVSHRMIDKSMRTQYYSQQMVSMAEGDETARKIYVQGSLHKNNKDLERFYAQYSLSAKALIACKNWFTEKELIEKLRGYTMKKKTFYSGTCLPKLLTELGLCRVTCTKQLSCKLNIRPGEISIGHAKIILPKEVLEA